MTYRIRKIIRGNPYLYDVTSYRENGVVKKRWVYVGPASAEGRQEVSEEVMADLSRVLLRQNITAKAIAAVAKRHRLRLPRSNPEVICLENNRRRRKLSARFK